GIRDFHVTGVQTCALPIFPVADEVARRLGAPLDVIVVRKLGAPFNPELAVGAIASGGVVVLSPDSLAATGLRREDIEPVLAREQIGRASCRERVELAAGVR